MDTDDINELKYWRACLNAAICALELDDPHYRFAELQVAILLAGQPYLQAIYNELRHAAETTSPSAQAARGNGR
jgi:hypothetical protein